MNPELSNSELETNPQQVAEQQVATAQEWATLYADPGREQGSKSAEIVLRNPLVYLRDVNPQSLPEELQTRWHKLLDFSEALAVAAATRPVEWGADVVGLEKIQGLVRDGDIDPAFRGSVADVMKASSALFADSTQHIPGNTKYYAGNVRGAANWLHTEQSR